MKKLTIVIAVLFSIFCTKTSMAQQTTATLKSDTVKVWGNCGMCKNRIEKAAKGAGASTASWNSTTQMLIVSYDAGNSSLEKIQKAIAKKGHDTRDFEATDADYNKLPGCCLYERRPM